MEEERVAVASLAGAAEERMVASKAAAGRVAGDAAAEATRALDLAVGVEGVVEASEAKAVPTAAEAEREGGLAKVAAAEGAEATV